MARPRGRSSPLACVVWPVVQPTVDTIDTAVDEATVGELRPGRPVDSVAIDGERSRVPEGRPEHLRYAAVARRASKAAQITDVVGHGPVHPGVIEGHLAARGSRLSDERLPAVALGTEDARGEVDDPEGVRCAAREGHGATPGDVDDGLLCAAVEGPPTDLISVAVGPVGVTSVDGEARRFCPFWEKTSGAAPQPASGHLETQPGRSPLAQ